MRSLAILARRGSAEIVKVDRSHTNRRGTVSQTVRASGPCGGADWFPFCVCAFRRHKRGLKGRLCPSELAELMHPACQYH